MRQQVSVVRTQTDYILGSDCRVFHNVAIRDPRHNSDYFIVVGDLCGAYLREHSNYLRSRIRLPLCPTGRKTRTRADKLFSELRCSVPKPDKQLACHNSWISAETWRLVDKRVSTRRYPGQYHQRLTRLGRSIQDSLK